MPLRGLSVLINRLSYLRRFLISFGGSIPRFIIDWGTTTTLPGTPRRPVTFPLRTPGNAIPVPVPISFPVSVPPGTSVPETIPFSATVPPIPVISPHSPVPPRTVIPRRPTRVPTALSPSPILILRVSSSPPNRIPVPFPMPSPPPEVPIPPIPSIPGILRTASSGPFFTTVLSSPFPTIVDPDYPTNVLFPRNGSTCRLDPDPSVFPFPSAVPPVPPLCVVRTPSSRASQLSHL